MRDEDAFDAIVHSFEAAARSFEAARRLLLSLIAVDPEEFEDPYEKQEPPSCAHRDAVEISTLGDQGRVFICPDCGEQFS